MDLNKAKTLTNLTSEQVLGLIEPPDHNCPYLDRKKQKIEKHLARKDLDFETRALLKEMKHAIEDLRIRFEDLRNWGQDWKDHAKHLIEVNGLDFVSEKAYHKLKY